MKERALCNEYLYAWNTESFERWKSLYGNLPQFSSLKDSGIREDYRRLMVKPTLGVKIKESFAPINKK